MSWFCPVLYFDKEKEKQTFLGYTFEFRLNSQLYYVQFYHNNAVGLYIKLYCKAHE